MTKSFKLWRLFLPFLFLFVLIHLLKDITQDILGIKTPLDILGDVKEDLSWFPASVRNMYIGLGWLSFLAEGFLVVSIPLVLKRREFSKSEKFVVVVSALLLLYFVIAIMLDPNYKPF